MAFSKNVWNQIKNLTKDEIIGALKRDGWNQDPASKDATIAFLKEASPKSKRIVIHYHPHATCGPNLLRDLISEIGWTEADLKRLKLIK